MYQFTIDSSPLGRLTMASDGKNLTGLWIEGQKYFGAQNSCIGSGEMRRGTADFRFLMKQKTGSGSILQEKSL